MTTLPPLAAYVGLDWADTHHDISLQASGRDTSDTVERCRLAHTPEAIHQWAAALAARFPGGTIGIAVETSRGPLLSALLEHEQLLLYPINPKSLQRFRETFTPSGAKDDMPDADLLRELLETHRGKLTPWQPDDAATRMLRRLVEHRRRVVDARTTVVQQLTAALKEYFPQALAWAGEDLTSPVACDFLERWPTLDAVQRARAATVQRFYHQHNVRRRSAVTARLGAIRTAVPLTTDPAIIDPQVLLVRACVAQLRALTRAIADFEAAIAERFRTHPDAEIFASFPGSGPTLAPRLLAAFGTDRTRFATPALVQEHSGIAPITRRSGKSCTVTWRFGAPTFLRQTFHEYASQSIRWCDWARAYYAAQRGRGASHHEAVRALAFKWIRILWCCWQTQTPYDDAQYVATLHRRGSPLAKHLPLPTAA